MTPYPIKGLKQREREVFEQVATGNYSLAYHSHKKAAIKKLLDIVAIVQVGATVICKDRFGVVTTPEYEVPLPLHAAWCRWCSDNAKELGIDDENPTEAENE